MLRHVVISTKLILLSTVLLGLFYPWAITGIAQVVWPDRRMGAWWNGRLHRGFDADRTGLSRPSTFILDRLPEEGYDASHRPLESGAD